MALLDDIGAALVTAGIAQTSNPHADWMLYLGYMQGDPGRAIAIIETAGPAPEEGLALDYPSFQVSVRGNADDYQAVRSKLDEIYKALHAQEATINAGVSPASGAYVYVYAAHSGPVPLGQDENRRPRLAMNFRSCKGRS